MTQQYGQPGVPMPAGFQQPRPPAYGPTDGTQQQLELMRRQQLADGEAQTQYKSAGAAYLLWFFTGAVGGHRFYLRSKGVALGMLFTLGGLGFWAFFDAFTIGGQLSRVNGEIRREVYARHGLPLIG